MPARSEAFVNTRERLQSTRREVSSDEKRQQRGALARSRVLVVEDDLVVGSLIERALKASHDVELAANGLEALALVTSQPAYDIIFCDLTMPHMTGIELYQRVLGEQPEVAERFVFMTGGATGSAEEFLERLPNEKLAKPFSVRALQSLAMNLLIRAQRAPSTDPTGGGR